MIQNLSTSVQGLWRRLSWGQRFTIVGLSAAVVASLALLMTWAGAPTYQVLFSNLPSTDASAIQTQLESAKIPYQLANGGTTILAPQAMVDGERLKLAGQGLPQGAWSASRSSISRAYFRGTRSPNRSITRGPWRAS